MIDSLDYNLDYNLTFLKSCIMRIICLQFLHRSQILKVSVKVIVETLLEDI